MEAGLYLRPEQGYNAAVPQTRLVRHRTLLFAACTLAAVAITGCGPSPTNPSTGAPFSQTDLRLGTGADAVAGKTLTANYTGWLYDPAKSDQKGLQFETSVGGTALTFTLGSGQVIPGLEQGVTGMKVGGERRIIIPSSLAYGAVRNGPIPAFSTIIFEVDLLDVQ
jgi:FKBP-type peptidyl-prolyl cis-trans isomerase FkpA